MPDRSATEAPPGAAAPTVPRADRGAADHFATVAPRYRSLRITDHAPVRDIGIELQATRLTLGPRRLLGFDVGAGTGRYTEALCHELGYRGTVVAVDRSMAMLSQLEPAAGNSTGRRRAAVRSDAGFLPVRDCSLDFVTTFNAVHHFDLPAFVADVGRALRPGGQLFVYTRTPEQNGQSIWGRHFPGFAAREERLYCDATLLEALSQLGPVVARNYRFERSATPSELVERARGGSYSTFALYQPHELDTAIQRFLDAIGHSGVVTWSDENLLVQVTVPRPAGCRAPAQ